MSAIRVGYKQTEVGLIPDGWITQTIAQASRKIQDYRGRTPKKLGMDWGGGVIPALSAGNVKMGFIDFDEECYLASELLYKRWMVNGDIEQNDIVFTMEAPLGNVALIPDNRKYILSQRTVLLQTNPDTIFNPFLYQVLMSRWFQRQLFENATGSTAQGIQRKKLENLSVVCPPLPEQRAIAAALSDVDALLAKLDRFIAKKRDLKQATMQQLLTGQTRLPGFSGAWEVVPLPDLSWFQEGPGVRTHQFTLSGVKLLNGTNISNGRLLLDSTMRYVSNEEAEGAYKHFLMDEGDILLATSGVTIDKLHEKVAVAQHEQLPLCMNTSTVRFKVTNSRLIASYLYLFLRSDVFKKQIGRQATGSAQLNFGPSHLKKVDIPLPPSLPEQTAIATVLSDMDAELTALETRRDKTCALKQGMMQELLTGRIRLV